MDYEAVIKKAIAESDVAWCRPEGTPLDEHLLACIQRLKDQRDGHYKQLMERSADLRTYASSRG